MGLPRWRSSTPRRCGWWPGGCRSGGNGGRRARSGAPRRPDASWNAYLLPLVIFSSQNHYTLPLAVASFQSTYTQDTARVYAFTALSMIPALAIFIFAQRKLVGGLVGAIRG